jgi:hypothetical protein
MIIDNKKILIGAGVLVVGYLLWKKNQSNSVAKTDVITPQSSMTQQEKIDLFNKAIQQYNGGAYPQPKLLETIAKSRAEANDKIKELKLDSEFSTWLSARPKLDYGMLPPN